MDIEANFHRARQLHLDKKVSEADKLCRGILEEAPGHIGASRLLAFMKSQRGELEEARLLLVAALRHHPGSAEAHFDHGVVLAALGRNAEALASIDHGLLLASGAAQAHELRGRVLFEIQRLEEALASFDRAVALSPGFVGAYSNRGITLRNLGRAEEALASFDRGLALAAANPGLHNNRGNALRDLRRSEEALASFDRAIALSPELAEAHSNRAYVLAELKRPGEALASFDRAIALNPNHAEAHSGRSSILLEMKRADEALSSVAKALAARPAYADAHLNYGNILSEIGRPAEALASYRRALDLDPDHRLAFGLMANAALHACDFDAAREISRTLPERIEAGCSIVPPFALLGYETSAYLQRKCASCFMRYKVPSPLSPLWRARSLSRARLRIAYMSADFHEHATAYLTARLIELHDRSRFEVLALSVGPDDQSKMRVRLAKAFDRFHEASALSDREAASLLAREEVDIVVNLTGFTRSSRPWILAHRPAPIQVSYLGYPGTMGSEAFDYIIADGVALPFDQQPHYAEKIVHLPECYQVNDGARPIGRVPDREAVGLPERGFVFCCFNNNWKITRPILDIWMHLLRAVEGSVLWLLRDNDDAAAHLREAARAHRVDPSRLRFAERAPQADHLARHALADLFLDTLPYNAHATAGDALLAGVPLLTILGGTFPSRVAASLLYAVGLPELVALNLDDYRALGLRLAADPSLLGSLRARLASNLPASTLFDTDRRRRQLEAAYAKMWKIHELGETPRGFSVELA